MLVIIVSMLYVLIAFCTLTVQDGERGPEWESQPDRNSPSPCLLIPHHAACIQVSYSIVYILDLFIKCVDNIYMWQVCLDRKHTMIQSKQTHLYTLIFFMHRCFTLDWNVYLKWYAFYWNYCWFNNIIQFVHKLFKQPWYMGSYMSCNFV